MTRGRAVRLVVVAGAGALGTLARYGITRAHPSAPGAFPWTTFVVNLVGAGVIGALAGRGVVGSATPGAVAVSAGFLGAFTTFSALSVETVLLVDAGRTGTAVAYLLLSASGGLAACALSWRRTARVRDATGSGAEPC